MQDLDALLEKATEALRREINNLFLESSNRKLSPTSARDLVAYVRLLSDFKKSKRAEDDELPSTPTDTLEKIATELIERSRQNPK